ncbi:hypothetical protein [Caldimonas sp. KR1-144]|uniref:hypothetical protein n=1 Tax=Caldimonas sp. KR1-144 TaxID=3400911 RepID=UPI003C0E239A
MREIHSYVIRVYRRDADAVAGLVEDVGTSRVAPFQSLAELCELLAGRKPFPRRRTTDHAPAKPAA